MKNQKGFIQIPLLIAIIVGVLILSGAGYFGVKQYQNYQMQNIEKERVAQEVQQQKDLEVQKLQQEIDALKNQPPQIIKHVIKETPAPNAGNDVTAIIKQWRPRVAFIDCKVVTASNVEIGRQSGSGYILGADTESGYPVLLTNNHIIDVVLRNLNGEPIGLTMTPTSCDIKIPGDSQFTTVYNVERGSSETVFAGSKEKDFGIVNIKSPTPYMKQVIGSNGGPMCSKKAELGEKILILGYPGIGDQNDVTATDGIVSGYDGDYYITSAKVESGNSGGVAISLKNNCYLGIPTFVQMGNIESLARILDIRAIFP